MFRRLRRVTFLVVVALVATVTSPGVPEVGAAPRPTGDRIRLWDDDFRHGFDTEGPDARWNYIAAGPYVADDGIVHTSRRGLDVVSSGTNPTTGEPAFVRTLAQEDDNGSGLPGVLDHIKWFAIPNHTASTGFPGFDAEPGRVVSCETWMSARTYGTDDHPFGSAVADPDSDLRLASAIVNAGDPETSIIFDFFVTNEQIYAFYERLPDQRAQLGNYAAFSYAIPVVERTPGERNHLTISYDRSAGVVRWLVDGEEVFRVDQLGYRLDSREHLVIDHGGTEQPVEPRQLRCGMGLLSLLDGELPGQSALVRLSSAPSFYFDPTVGEPEPQTFLDEESLDSNRLFGQGAGLSMSRYVVTSAPARR
jgi:hypothetical protein